MILMEAVEEEETGKKYPSLPSNYVSLTQLQERWLQQQKQKQQKQEEEKQEGKQAEEKHQEGRTVENQHPEKKRQNFYRNRQRSNNGGGRRIEGQRVYVARRVLDGKSPKKIGAEEVRNGVESVDGMENKMKGKGKKKYGNSKKRMARVEGGLIGEDLLRKLSETWGISGCSSGKNGVQEGCSGELEGNGDRNRGVEENVSLCMEEVAPENKGKDVNLIGLGGKCGGDEVFGQGVWRNSNDRGVEGEGVSVCMIEVLPENDELEEEVPATGNGDDQARGVTQEVGNVCMVEMLQDIKVEEDASVGVGRKNGKGGLGGRQQEKDSNSGKRRVPKDSKSQFELGKVEKVEEGVCNGEKERNGYRKGQIGRGIQAHQRKERTSGDLGRDVRRDLQVLSLDDSRKGNVTSRKGLQGGRWGRYGNSREGIVTSRNGLQGGRWGRYGNSREGIVTSRNGLQGGRWGRCGKSSDGGLVWVKKGEISDTNAAEI